MKHEYIYLIIGFLVGAAVFALFSPSSGAFNCADLPDDNLAGMAGGSFGGISGEVFEQVDWPEPEDLGGIWSSSSAGLTEKEFEQALLDGKNQRQIDALKESMRQEADDNPSGVWSVIKRINLETGGGTTSVTVLVWGGNK